MQKYDYQEAATEEVKEIVLVLMSSFNVPIYADFGAISTRQLKFLFSSLLCCVFIISLTHHLHSSITFMVLM